jgi:hypothetical protein
MEQEVNIEVKTLEAVRSREEVVVNAQWSVNEETVLVVDDELLQYTNFDECLSQQI